MSRITSLLYNVRMMISNAGETRYPLNGKRGIETGENNYEDYF